MDIISKFQYNGETFAIVKLNKSKTWTAQQKFERVDSEGPLVQTHPAPVTKPVRSRTKSRTWERTIQASLAGGAASILCLAFGQEQLTRIIAPLTASTYWFGSTLLGTENWDVVFRLLDRNRDGRVDFRDLQAFFDDWWEKGEADERTPAPQSTTDQVVYGYELHRMMPDRSLQRAILLPDYPRYVTKQKLIQCARLYFELDGNKNFSKRQCGEPFGDDIAQIQDELERLGYVAKKGKAKNAPRGWTPEGKRWLEGFL